MGIDPFSHRYQWCEVRMQAPGSELVWPVDSGGQMSMCLLSENAGEETFKDQSFRACCPQFVWRETQINLVQTQINFTEIDISF